MPTFAERIRASIAAFREPHSPQADVSTHLTSAPVPNQGHAVDRPELAQPNRSREMENDRAFPGLSLRDKGYFDMREHLDFALDRAPENTPAVVQAIAIHASHDIAMGAASQPTIFGNTPEESQAIQRFFDAGQRMAIRDWSHEHLAALKGKSIGPSVATPAPQVGRSQSKESAIDSPQLQRDFGVSL